MNELLKPAVIYCRVSSVNQTRRGDGLASQESRCREFAKFRNYDVLDVFTDDMTGTSADRPGLKKMLALLRRQRSSDICVIIDDITRLARGLSVHLELREALRGFGATLLSPSMEFKDDPDSMFVEHVLASVSEHHSGKNRDQTISRMRGRMLNGHWPFNPPVGYTWAKLPEHGKTYVRDEPVASILQEALEGFANGRFETQAEVRRFLEAQPAFPKNRKTGKLTNQRVKDVLTQRLYAGYIEYPKWNVSLRKAQFDPIISFEVFQRIQDRLNGRPKAPARKDISVDFPLRGFVLCDECEKPLTACWSKGRKKHYPYYYCVTSGCESRGKSVRKETIEAEFDDLLADAKPTQRLFDLAGAMFRDMWDQRIQRVGERKQAMQRQLSKIESQVESIVDRIVSTENARVVETYEKRLARLDADKIVLNEKIEKAGKPVDTFEESFRTALSFLGNPQKIWRSGRFEDQRAVLRLTFADNLKYAPKKGFRTANLSLPFKLLRDFSVAKNGVARLRGFEPLTT
ncbi:recombinase family protein [Chromatocurvus halotolerans]|uniref:recombinase family protein n=1 Tax=Chromatocurvus halotolerans TaxID=1132028 RepID=UPI000E3ED946|nr:recombinase family protein [Chromatocurvus halotolerans]